MIIKNNNILLFSSPTIPALPISMFKFFSRCFRFKKSMALPVSFVSGFKFKVGSVITSDEKIKGILLLNNSIKISSLCSCRVSLMSLFIGSNTLIFIPGTSSKSRLAYFVMASFPAVSLSKAKIISSNCLSSFIALMCSSVSPLVP